MKAIVTTQYGSPDVLRLEEVKKPRPEDDEGLVKVHAASINLWDWDMVPVIDRLYPLSETADAFRYFGRGDVQGKVVITILAGIC